MKIWKKTRFFRGLRPRIWSVGRTPNFSYPLFIYEARPPRGCCESGKFRCSTIKSNEAQSFDTFAPMPLASRSPSNLWKKVSQKTRCPSLPIKRDSSFVITRFGFVKFETILNKMWGH